MYHIANDIRAKKSADLIVKGLEDCLKEKPLSQIKIMDIYNKSYVSRATFYRLFDSIDDVITYECDCLVEIAMQNNQHVEFKNKKEIALYSIKLWLKHETLVKMFVENRLFMLFYNLHLRHKDKIKKIYSIDFEDELEINYFISFLASIIFITFVIYYQEKKAISIEEAFETANKALFRVAKAWEN